MLAPPYFFRSIPACAGEPMRVTIQTTSIAVYPRVCGGTLLLHSVRKLATGLSPRVRGNPASPSPPLASSRSIPACAGEPAWDSIQHRLGGVYPRVCGGTLLPYQPTVGEIGLSPRVRGNRPDMPTMDTHKGSIPACAGEPRRDRMGSIAERVYPRVCGGTCQPCADKRY